MTVSTTVNKAGPYSLNGVTTQFSYSYPITNTSDVKVYITDTDGSSTMLSTGYRVVPNNALDLSTGGYVEYPYPLVTPASGGSITLNRELTPTQTTDLKNRGANVASVYEAAIDRQTMLYQQILEMISRAALADISQGSGTYEYPAPSAGKAIVWNAGGTGFVNQDLQPSANNFNTQIISTVATGTAPINVSSTTECPNLHAATATISSNCTGNSATATIADAAKGDTRFQISGNVGGSSNIVLNGSSSLNVQSFCVTVPNGKALKVKRSRYYIDRVEVGTDLRIKIYCATGGLYWQSATYGGEETTDTTIRDGGGTTYGIGIYIVNTHASNVYNIKPDAGWWFDLSIE